MRRDEVLQLIDAEIDETMGRLKSTTSLERVRAAVKQLDLPGWHDKPTGPWLWVVELETGGMFALQVGPSELAFSSIARRCYGPIPAPPEETT